MALKAALVPDFVQTIEPLDRVNGLLAPCALTRTHPDLSILPLISESLDPEIVFGVIVSVVGLSDDELG